MFGKEPAVIFGAISEVIRAVIPTLIIFGFIHWSGDQVAQFMLLIGVVVGALNVTLTRSQTVSAPQVDKLITTATNQAPNTPPAVVKDIQAAKDAQ